MGHYLLLSFAYLFSVDKSVYGRLLLLSFAPPHLLSFPP